MLRAAIHVFGILAALFALATGPCVAQSWDSAQSGQGFAGRERPLPRIGAGLPSWMRDLFERRWPSLVAPVTAELSLQAPASTSDLVFPLTVSTRLAGMRAFQIDVDLNHDGTFEGCGELGYAQGRFDRSGVGTVRLHGPAHGQYQMRVRGLYGTRGWG